MTELRFALYYKSVIVKVKPEPKIKVWPETLPSRSRPPWIQHSSAIAHFQVILLGETRLNLVGQAVAIAATTTREVVIATRMPLTSLELVIRTLQIRLDLVNDDAINYTCLRPQIVCLSGVLHKVIELPIIYLIVLAIVLSHVFVIVNVP